MLQIPWGVPLRAYQTFPPQLMLKQSIIPEANLGVFATTFISKYTWLAEFEGDVVTLKADISDYAWEVSYELSHFFNVVSFIKSIYKQRFAIQEGYLIKLNTIPIIKCPNPLFINIHMDLIKMKYHI